MTCFLLGVSSLFLLVDLATTSLRSGFQVYLLALGSVIIGQGSTIFVGNWILFLNSLFFLG